MSGRAAFKRYWQDEDWQPFCDATNAIVGGYTQAELPLRQACGVRLIGSYRGWQTYLWIARN